MLEVLDVHYGKKGTRGAPPEKANLMESDLPIGALALVCTAVCSGISPRPNIFDAIIWQVERGIRMLISGKLVVDRSDFSALNWKARTDEYVKSIGEMRSGSSRWSSLLAVMRTRSAKVSKRIIHNRGPPPVRTLTEIALPSSDVPDDIMDGANDPIPGEVSE